MLDSKPLLQNSHFPTLTRSGVTTLQLNLGYLCNLSCVHCHVNAGPKRTELMSKKTMDEVLQLAVRLGVKTFDLTGGAPEMNPQFRYLVTSARQAGIDIIDRCNLTILLEEGFEDLAAFLAQQQVNIVASLPCYLEDNVNKQRGKGVFKSSIIALQKLNALGYGQPNSDLTLDLVFNPQGTNLPPAQKPLEESYKQHLQYDGIVFNQLFTITNMPIQRFGSTLMSKGLFDDYMDMLIENYNADTLQNVMCKTTLSIDWQGYVYDCDFNQMLSLPMADKSQPVHISELDEQNLAGQQIATRQHCYGCTAGQGSSCSGALS